MGKFKQVYLWHISTFAVAVVATRARTPAGVAAAAAAASAWHLLVVSGILALWTRSVERLLFLVVVSFAPC